MSSFAHGSLKKTARRPHVDDVIMYVWPLLVACSRGGLIGEPQRLKPQIVPCHLRRALKARPFKAFIDQRIGKTPAELIFVSLIFLARPLEKFLD